MSASTERHPLGRSSPVEPTGPVAPERPTTSRRPLAGALLAALVAAFAAAALVAHAGLHSFAEQTIDGIVQGSVLALAALGLTLIFGVMRVVNFAHGDMLTLGAYLALLGNVTLGLPLPVAAAIAIIGVGACGGLSEMLVWRPMRRAGAGTAQLLLTTLGLAFLLRYAIVFVAAPDPRELDVNQTATLSLAGLRVGRAQAVVVVVAIALLAAVALALNRSGLGKQTRALSENLSLAQTTGINANRVLLVIWVLCAGLTGLSGTMYAAAVGQFTPFAGSSIILSLFAAVIVGGLGNAYGALAGGLMIGVIEAWSTLLIAERWSSAVGFGVLIAALVLRPQGLLGRAQREI